MRFTSTQVRKKIEDNVSVATNQLRARYDEMAIESHNSGFADGFKAGAKRSRYGSTIWMIIGIAVGFYMARADADGVSPYDRVYATVVAKINDIQTNGFNFEWPQVHQVQK